MDNKKILFCTFFLILSGILINNIEDFIYQNNSKGDLQNVGHYNESSTAPFGTLTPSQSEEGNLGRINKLSLSNSMGVVVNITGIGLTSYPRENLTLNFELYDINLSRTIEFDENNPASFLINYTKSNGVMDNGTLVNHIDFNNNSKKYNGIIGISVLTEGTYNITIYINLLNYTIIPYTFSLTIKALTYMDNIGFSDPGGVISGPSYYSFIGNNISIEFRLREMGVNISYVLAEDNQTTYQIVYSKITGTRENGILSNQINLDNIRTRYSGIIETSNLSIGTYIITINISLLNYTIVLYSFRLTVIEKHEVLMFISKPREIIAGEKLTVIIFAQYGENSEFYFLERTYIKLKLYKNDGELIFTSKRRTDDLGRAYFVLIPPLYTNNISISVELPSAWNHEGLMLEITDIKIIPSLNFIVMLTFLIGLIISFAIASIFLYIKLIIPNKRKKNRIVNELKQTFEDLSKINCIFIISKKNGKSIFNKSFISKKINQEKVRNYISSLSNFNITVKSQKTLSEIKYKDKILLIADGSHIRVSLVLSKKSSTILKNNLKEFIYSFENYYENTLKNLHDKLIPFREIENILEDKLNIFNIIPHKIENDFLDNIPTLKSDSKDFPAKNGLNLTTDSINLFYKTVNLIRKTGKNFFYISTLLNEFSKSTHKGIIKFFVCVNELRDKGFFTTMLEQNQNAPF